MKKLNHANVIKLHEVIDDPDEDQLFMSLIFRNSNFSFKIISLRLCLKGASDRVGWKSGEILFYGQKEWRFLKWRWVKKDF